MHTRLNRDFPTFLKGPVEFWKKAFGPSKLSLKELDFNFKLIKDHGYKMLLQLPFIKTQENLYKNVQIFMHL